MSEYGVTEKGFVLKRMDTILNEIHGELTEGFGVDTRLSDASFLNVLVTTFAGQIADLWETAQDSYYAKYPATATGINLDHAVQYGGIRRNPSKHTYYPLHFTGDDGAFVREHTMVATDTKPQLRLYAASEFWITRESFNSVRIVVAVAQAAVYTITINGEAYHYSSIDGEEAHILEGLQEAIQNADYSIKIEKGALMVEDTKKGRSNVLSLSENLTTQSVTTIANLFTENYGRVTLPYGIVNQMVNNIPGFESVENLLQPVYGRLAETDIELRQSYLAKPALRSNTMIDSIVAELLNNVADIESASGYENETDETDERGLPLHSIEIVVEGGKEEEIAGAILRRKAGGIQTYGQIVVDVPGNYGDSIPIRFNRPDYLYTWIRVILYGDSSKLPMNYVSLATQSILEEAGKLISGMDLLVQLFHEGIYKTVAGVTYVETKVAYSKEKLYVPSDCDYTEGNVIVTSRQKVLLDETRIEVSFYENT